MMLRVILDRIISVIDKISAHKIFDSYGGNVTTKLNGVLVQLVRIMPCHGRGHEFESRTYRRKHRGVEQW